MDLQRGFRDQLGKYVDVSQAIDVNMRVSGQSVYDFCCFGVDVDGKLSDDRYMVFYNQTQSPSAEITYSAVSGGVDYRVDLDRLPASIQRLVFTVSIDGSGTMGNIVSHEVTISQNGKKVARMLLRGQDFHSEKAIISIELYRKGVWRFAAVANGFNGGLGDLLRSYGGEELTAPPQPAPQKTEKISLKKGQKVSLSKNSGTPIIIENGWTAAGKDYDLKALVRYRSGKLVYVGASNSDEVMSTPEGAVRHGGDVTAPGELEHINIVWHPDIASVAVSSYSAIENGTGSFYRYGVFVRIRNGNQTIEIPAANTSANDKSYTLCFGEILFGEKQGEMEVSALELYSARGSERRVGYVNGMVQMDAGPCGQKKS